MKYLFLIALTGILSAGTPVKPTVKPVAKTPEVKTMKDSFAYAYGMYCGVMMNNIKNKSMNWDVFRYAFEKAMKEGDTSMMFDRSVMNEILNTYSSMSLYGGNKDTGAAYQAMALKNGFMKTPSGLLYKVIRNGNGRKPGLNDSVQVYYTGKYTEGKVFDSNVGQAPMKTTLKGGMIQGFLEALRMMDEASKYEVIIPYDLGYGEEGMRNPYSGEMNIEPYRTLVFTIEIDAILPAKP